MKKTRLANLALGLLLGLVIQTSHAEKLSVAELNLRAVETVIWGMPAVNYDLML